MIQYYLDSYKILGCWGVKTETEILDPRCHTWDLSHDIEYQKWHVCPGRVAQWVTVLFQYAKVAGSIPGRGTYKNEPMNAPVSGTTNHSLSL